MLNSDSNHEYYAKINICLYSGCCFINSLYERYFGPECRSEKPIHSSILCIFYQCTAIADNTLTSSNVNLNIFRLIVQHWQETQYPEESQYDLGTREINDNFWTALYRDVIRDLREAKALTPVDILNPDGSPNTGKQQNNVAIAEIMEIYTWYYLVTTFGNIPYSDAMNIENAFPKYDDAKTIYDDLLTRLDVAIGDLNPANESFGSADIIYGGDVALWKKFANSLKLKMGITIADEDNAKAKAIVESAVAGGVFTSNADNAELAYLGAPPNTNPIWVDLVQSGRDDFVAASTLIDQLEAFNDPRIDNFFTEDQAGRDLPLTSYSGADPGVQSAYAPNSHVHPAITAPAFPGFVVRLCGSGVVPGRSSSKRIRGRWYSGFTLCQRSYCFHIILGWHGCRSHRLPRPARCSL